MLKQRIITALLLLPAVLGGILLLSTEYFSVLWATVMSVAAYEWLKLSGIKNKLSLIVGLIVLNGLFISIWFYPFANISVEWFVLIAWLLVIISFTGDPVARLKRCSSAFYSVIGIAIGLVVIFPTWLAMVLLHQHNPWMVLHVFGIVWIADTGAYFSGKLFGKRKLAPAISPGKSWEGVWGALLAVVIYSSLVSFWWQDNEQQQWLFVVICMLAAIASVAGDLLESVFKRAIGVKDSGRILPGHGGAMDRLDSITAAAPVFAAGYYLAGWL
ncbi:MAG: phosphatidate cytidylyltransferase [Sulfuriflexus sp.]|nr:phosphatidate cytidylyltransferase [Sulfuriflexus sp.]